MTCKLQFFCLKRTNSRLLLEQDQPADSASFQKRNLWHFKEQMQEAMKILW